MSRFQSGTDARRRWCELWRLGLNSFGGLFEFFEPGEVLEAASSTSGGVSASSVKFFTRLTSSTDVEFLQVLQPPRYIFFNSKSASELRWEEDRVAVWLHCIVIWEDKIFISGMNYFKLRENRLVCMWRCLWYDWSWQIFVFGNVVFWQCRFRQFR